MTIINSVLGPLETANLGITLMNEHILGSSIGFPQNYPDLLERGYMNHIVDATTLDLGRDVNMLAEVSRRTGVNIIACSGWWLEKTRFLSGASDKSHDVADYDPKLMVEDVVAILDDLKINKAHYFGYSMGGMIG